MRYELLEHTADVMLKAHGATLEECFENAAYALFDQMVHASRIEPRTEISFEVKGDDLESLLYAFLSEFLYIRDAKMLVRAWQEFTRETVEGSAEPADGASAKDKRGAFDLVAEKSSNTAQGALLDGYGDAHMATETTSAVMRPSLLSRGYDKKVHLGMCAVVVGTDLRVISLWGAEGDAKVAAKRVARARVVDSQGYLIPKAEVEATPEVAPDEVVLGVPVLPVQV
jgi:SHS2 domain-containing protein